MEIKLLFASSLEYVISGIRTCYESQKLSSSYHDVNGNFVLGKKDKVLINQIIESDHTSTLEHSMIVFRIEGFSRAVLQEFSRHRIGVSPSVKSTRYTLKELKDEEPFDIFNGFSIADGIYSRTTKYLVMTGIDDIDMSSIMALENVRKMLVKGYPNDKVKYCLPESYKTSGQYTFSLRGLCHLLKLRTDPRALWEFRELAFKIYELLPEEYKFIADYYVYKEPINE